MPWRSCVTGAWHAGAGAPSALTFDLMDRVLVELSTDTGESAWVGR